LFFIRAHVKNNGGNESFRHTVMKSMKSSNNNERDIDRRLLQYLLWGQTTNPARFRYLKDFIAWAEPLGYPAEPCREVWFELRKVYRPLYGEPVFEN
jgi:hypothetical protein